MTHNDELATMREKADAHQHDIEAKKLWTVQNLMARWSCSAGTVTAIPVSLLPYMNIGRGHVREHRRYNPDDVYAYESAQMGKAS